MISTILLVVLAALLGLAFCFVGYRLFLVMLPIWGFFAGFWIGAYATSLILGTGFLGTTLALVVGVVAGIVGAVLSYLFYMVGVALISAALGGFIGSGVMGALGIDPGLLTTIVVIVSALVAVVLSLILNIQKWVIIVFTAIAGAALIVLSAMILFGQVTRAELQSGGGMLTTIAQGSWLWGLIWLALLVAGVVIQIRTSRGYEFTNDMHAESWG